MYTHICLVPFANSWIMNYAKLPVSLWISLLAYLQVDFHIFGERILAVASKHQTSQIPHYHVKVVYNVVPIHMHV